MDPFQFEHRVSSFGIPVYWKNIPWITGWTEIRVGLPIGAWCDPVGKEGCAHFLEHIPFRGTTKFPTYEDIQRQEKHLFFNSLNASTGFDLTIFRGKCFTAELDAAMEVFRDMLFFPCIRDADFFHEQEVVVREIWQSMGIRKEMELGRRKAVDLFGGDHPCGRMSSPLGWEETVRNITPADFTEFHQAYYHLGNISLLFVGDVTEEMAFDAADRFGECAPRAPAVLPRQIPHAWPAPRCSEHDISAKEWYGVADLEAARVLVTRVMPRQKQYEALVMLQSTLGSVLHDLIREELHATYGVDAHAHRMADHDRFSIDIRCAPDAVDHVRSIIASLLHEFDSKAIIEERFEENKMLSLKNYAVAEWSAHEIAGYAMQELLTEGAITPYEDMNIARSEVTYGEVCRMVKEELADRLLYWTILRP